MPDIRFNCGEFKPGKRRIYHPPKGLPYTHKYIPGGGGGGFTIRSFPPVKPHQPKYACVCNKLCEKYSKATACKNQNDVVCMDVDMIPTGATRGRSFGSKSECEDKGRGEQPCWICSWKCVERKVPCPEPNSRITKLIDRDCVECSPKKDFPQCDYTSLPDCIDKKGSGGSTKCVDEHFGCPTPQKVSGLDPGGWKCDSNFNCVPCRGGEPNCFYSTWSECESECIYKSLPHQVAEEPEIHDAQVTGVHHAEGPAPDVLPPDNVVPGTITGGKGPIIGTITPPPVIGGITKPEFRSITVIDLNERSSEYEASLEDDDDITAIYHREYNFYSFEPINESEFVSNSENLHIFKDSITKEISYVMRIVDTSIPWKEFPFSQITETSLEISIREELLDAFDNIHTVGGKLIGRRPFINLIHGLLIKGRLEDFDANYYKELATKQSDDEIVVFEHDGTPSVMQRAALGILSDEAISLDSDSMDFLEKLQLKRTRFLNEDIEVVVPVTQSDGTVTSIEIGNPGMGYSTTASVSTAVPLGEGDGYYFKVTKADGTTVALPTDHSLTSTYFVDPSTRERSLEVFGSNSDINLSVTAADDKSEFDSAYTTTTTATEPKFFKLDLASVADAQSEDPLINFTTADYTLLTDTDDIATWVKNYGASITQVNVDYRDPFFNYAVEGEKISASINDISFRSFSPKRPSVNEHILARSIFMGIILVPGQGSAHLPLGGESRLSFFESDVSRTLTIVPDINVSDDYVSDANDVPLDEVLVLDQLNTNYIGLVEKSSPDDDNIMYTYDKDSDIYKNSFTSLGSVITTPTSIDRTAMGDVVRLIEDTLKARYNLDGLTWWDVFRRLTAKQMAELFTEAPPHFFSSLIKGDWRGVKIRDVLNRLTPTETGILSVKNDSISDTIILNQIDRERLTTYYA